MISAQNIILICWLIFFSYWLINWRRTKPTLTAKWNFTGLLPLALGVITLIILLKNFDLLSPGKTPLIFPQGLNIFLVIIGLTIAIIARRELGTNWSGKIAIKKDHQLITTGIYHYIRHPIYTGVLLMALGTALNINTLPALLLFIIILIFLIFKLKKEEELLTQHFPKEYPAYKSRTRSGVPFIF